MNHQINTNAHCVLDHYQWRDEVSTNHCLWDVCKLLNSGCRQLSTWGQASELKNCNCTRVRACWEGVIQYTT